MTSGLVFGLCVLALSALPSAPAVPVARLDVEAALPTIVVVIQLHSIERQLFVPVCGEDEMGTPILCGGSARLEIHTAAGWSPAKLRTDYGVLGAPPPARLGGRLLEPNGDARFLFLFSRADFDVKTGQRVRIVLDTWSDERSMKAGVTAVPLPSPPFRCPTSGMPTVLYGRPLPGGR